MGLRLNELIDSREYQFIIQTRRIRTTGENYGRRDYSIDSDHDPKRHNMSRAREPVVATGFPNCGGYNKGLALREKLPVTRTSWLIQVVAIAEHYTCTRCVRSKPRRFARGSVEQKMEPGRIRRFRIWTKSRRRFPNLDFKLISEFFILIMPSLYTVLCVAHLLRQLEQNMIVQPRSPQLVFSI
jgi:hypothetical protein